MKSLYRTFFGTILAFGFFLYGHVSSVEASIVKSFSKGEIKQIIMQEALRDGVVPVALALAVARVESNFQARVISHAGARGVMQIMPATARGEFGVASQRLFDPQVNIRLGIRFLHRLYTQYGNRWEPALSHYNGGTLKGRGKAAKPHSYTRKYVAKVTKYWRQYARQDLVLTSVAAADTIRLVETDRPKWGKGVLETLKRDAYWLLKDQGGKYSWREYLSFADQFLQGGIPEEGPIAEETGLSDLRAKFRRSLDLKRQEQETGNLDKLGQKRFM